MKLEKFKESDFILKKSELLTVKGGTSTTVYTQTGVWETEYEDCNGNGKLDEDEAKNNPIRVEKFKEATLKGWKYALDVKRSAKLGS